VNAGENRIRIALTTVDSEQTGEQITESE